MTNLIGFAAIAVGGILLVVAVLKNRSKDPAGPQTIPQSLLNTPLDDLVGPPAPTGQPPGSFLDGQGQVGTMQPGIIEDKFVKVGGNYGAARAFIGRPGLPSNHLVLNQALATVQSQFGLGLTEAMVLVLQRNEFPTLDPVLVMGTVLVESNDEALAVKAERNVKDQSIGLMQLRIQTARWFFSHDFNGVADELIKRKMFDRWNNLTVGMSYQRWQQERYSKSLVNILPGDLWMWIAAAYNAGTAFYNFKRRTFVNQAYVNKIGKIRATLQNTFPRNV